MPKGDVFFAIANIFGTDLNSLATILVVARFAIDMALQGSPGYFTFGFEIGNVCE